MVSVKIDNVPIDVEQGVEFVIDGSEGFNLGIMKILNSTKREAYPDYADVVLTVNGVDYEAVIQKDISIRTSNGVYKHDIMLAETVIKLAQYQMADRKYTTKDGLAMTWLDHLENLLLTQELGVATPFTIATDTQTLLDVEAAWKEYSGGDFLINLTDLFRGVGAVPTLSLDNEIGHELFGELGSLVSFADLVGETVTSDIADYGLAVYAKLKNAAYDKDLDIGTTYFPAKGYGASVRSSADKYSDDDAQYFLDSGIRRVPEANILNLSDSGTSSVVADISDWIVSKSEWDDFEIERDVAILHTGKYKNNTFYFVDGDNIIQNVGTKYKNGSATITGDDVMEHLIKSYWVKVDGTTTKYDAQSISSIEIEFRYQPKRDIDVRVERHNISRVTKNATLSSNQKDSELELGRNGNALKSLINRVGNDVYEVTLRYTNSTPFTLFNLNDYTSDGYKIVKVQLLTRNGSVDVIYKLTKNQSILNPLTSVNREVSPFTITKKNILSCFVVNSYIEFSDTSKTDETSGLTILGKEILLNAFNWDVTKDTPVYNAQFSNVGTFVYLNSSVSKFPQGSELVFNMQFNHPKIAGYQLTSDGIGLKLKPVSYTDAFGQVATAYVAFDNGGVVVPDDHPVGVVNSNSIINGLSYNVDLNPDEIFGLTHVIHPITHSEDLIVGNYFASNNSLMKELGAAQSLTAYYYDNTVTHNIYDEYAKSGWTSGVAVTLDAAYKVITHAVPTGKSWVIADVTTKRLYLAYNNNGTDLNTIYINRLNSRPNIEVL